MYGYLTPASSADVSGAALLWLVNNAALNVGVQKTCLRPHFLYIWVYKWE